MICITNVRLDTQENPCNYKVELRYVDVVSLLMIDTAPTIFGYREKPLRFSILVTVPQTNTRGQVENTKANETTMVKELGKTAVVTSG